jgi:hypothetical protein
MFGAAEPAAPAAELSTRGRFVQPRGAAMRKTVLFALAVAGTAVAVPALAHYLGQPSNDPLGDTLRGFGFLPLSLPTEHMRVGSLYYIDSSVRHFHVVCSADESDLTDAVRVSRAAGVNENALRTGRFATNVKVDANWLFSGDAKRDYKQTVRYSLTDVFVEEIDGDRNLEIYIKLMNKRSCNRAVMELIDAGGYVCQGQKMLRATAEFRLDLEAEGANATGTNIKDVVKSAIETQTEQRVVEKQGRLLAGSALNYGVAMKPKCMAPTTGYFKRFLPESVFGRIKNYLLFRILEPMLPLKEDLSVVAETALAVGG